MGEIKFMGALLMISLFVLAIVGYSLGYAVDNNSVVSVDPDGEFSSLNSSAQSSINSLQVQTNSSSTSFFDAKIEDADTTTVTGGQFKLGLGSLIDTTKSITKTTKKNLFGDNPAFAVVLTALSSFLIYMGVRYIWKTWKGGNPD
ncbi:hypothetical protein HN698_07515 [Candidatus Woesearchaeota archaeon]|jgi:hypothetical protein|nr:hypothetical protein [archaeon]MBT7931729.1 hypothetical protein [Candidatus Woesearchaeota archaeon]